MGKHFGDKIISKVLEQKKKGFSNREIGEEFYYKPQEQLPFGVKGRSPAAFFVSFSAHRSGLCVFAL